LATTQGNIHIFTKDEYWTYHPNEGSDLVSLGRLNPVDRSVGCAGKNAITYKRDRFVWADLNGVYESTGNYVVTKLSFPIDDFFGVRGLADPTTAFYTEQGHTFMDDPQPKTYYHFDPDRVQLIYWHDKEMILMSVPGEDCTLVLCDNNEWVIWTWESMVFAQGGNPRVRATKNIEEPWLLPYERELYLVGGPAERGDALIDASTRTGGAVDDDVTVFSYYILQYGRGGGIDRSATTEDYRGVAGKYIRTKPLRIGGSPSQGIIYIDPWLPTKTGDELPGSFVLNDATLTFLIPIVIVPRVNSNPNGIVTDIQIKIRFDDAFWIPLLINTDEIAYLLPPERLETNGGYTPGAPVAGVSEVRLYDFGTGVPSATGDEIRISWDSATAGLDMNMVANQRNRLMWIPMSIKTGQPASDLASMGLSITLATIDAQILAPCIWNQWSLQVSSRHILNGQAQAVDWAYKTMNLDPDQSVSVAGKGLNLMVESHGHGVASEQLHPDWIQGILNVLIDRDGAMWQAQRVDFSDDTGSSTTPAVTQNVTDQNTIKESYKDTPHSPLIHEPVFENSRVFWADATDNTTPAYLIADPIVTELSTSDATRGKFVSFLLHGYMRHRTNRLIFNRIVGRFMIKGAGPHVRLGGVGGSQGTVNPP